MAVGRLCVICLLLMASYVWSLPELTYKQGVIADKETWQGIVILTGDVVVPTGAVLTLRAGTIVVFPDVTQGSSPQRPPKLAVFGSVNRPEVPTNSVKFVSIHDPECQELREYWGAKKLVVAPAKVETERLASLWDRYRHRYVMSWLLTYGLVFVVL